MTKLVQFIVIKLIILEVKAFLPLQPTLPVGVKPRCYETQMVNGVEIEWLHSTDSLHYYSTPLCIDEKGLYVIRLCLGGHFMSLWQPLCTSIQMADYSCMDGLKLMYGKNNIFCYTKSEKTMPFDEEFLCPYKQVDAYDNTEYYFELSNKYPVWMPFHRRDRNGSIGYFVPDGFHGTAYEPWVVANDQKLSKNKCLSVNSGKLSGDCTKLRYHACVYRAIPLNLTEELSVSKMETDFCTKKCGSNARISWKRNTISCICPEPIAECEKPAVYPIATEGCALGLEKNVKGALIWTSSGEVVRNTFWAVDNLPSKLAKYIVSSETGWTTTDNVTCIMCEITFSPPENEITLAYDSDKKLATVTSSNPDRQFNAVDPYNPEVNYSVKCFMEAAGIALDISQVSSSGLWQCEVIDIADTSKKVVSNVVQMDFGRYNFFLQFIVNLNTRNIKVLYPVLDKVFKEYYSLVLIQWEEPSNDNEKWLKVLYRFDVQLENDEKYRQTYKEFNNELSGPVYADLKPEAYNLLFCNEFTTKQRGHTLIWPAAEIEQESQTDCFDETGKPMLIKCIRNFTLGARFTPVPECHSFGGNTTEQLSDLENAEAPPEEILTNLTNILQNNPIFTSQDFNKTANILEKLCEDANVTNVVSVVSMVMTKSPKALLDSQREVNTTDRLLSSLDMALKTKVMNDSEEILTEDNVECLFIDTDSSIYAGAAYLTSGEMVQLQGDLSIYEILDIQDLESAVYIEYYGTVGLTSITMFKSSVLFNEHENYDYNPFQRVFGVILPEGAEDILITLVFPREKQTDCAYWNYGQDTYGGWEIDCNSFVVDNFTVCLFNHTTHYGQLLMLRSPLGPVSDMILSTMTAIECSLSTVGLCIILITAVVFPTWRKRKGRLIHYCLVLLLQTILLFVNTNIPLESPACILVGALLHFTVLSQFCWMIVIAVHQHRTLVIVYQRKQSLWESRWVMVITYGLPLVAVGSAVAVDLESYTEGEYLGLSICYPSGNVLFFSLVLPTACIAFVNGCLFLWMLYKLTCVSRGPATPVVPGLYGTCISRNLDKIRTLALMVFTLGITWWLGFAALLFNNGTLLYLFSITTGMQGFLIFVVNILAKKDVWAMYCRKYKMWVVFKN